MKISTVITLSPAELLDASNRVQIEIADFIKLRRNESVEATVDPAKYVNNLILSGEPAMQKFAIHSSAYWDGENLRGLSKGPEGYYAYSRRGKLYNI